MGSARDSYSRRTEQTYRHWVKRFIFSSTTSATRPRWLNPRSTPS